MISLTVFVQLKFFFLQGFLVDLSEHYIDKDSLT